jgi:anti-sigma factor RsiW
MNCENTQNLVQPYLEGRLATLERNEFVHHVTECASCEAEVLAYREVFDALREMPRFEAPSRLSVAVMAHLRAEGLAHEPRFSVVRRLSDRFFALPSWIRYPSTALFVIALLYIPVGLWLGNADHSIVELAGSLARSVVWVRGKVAAFPGMTAFETYARAVRTVVHATGAVVSPVTWLIVTGVVIAAFFSVSRILRRKRQSGHALFSL